MCLDVHWQTTLMLIKQDRLSQYNNKFTFGVYNVKRAALKNEEVKSATRNTLIVYIKE